MQTEIPDPLKLLGVLQWTSRAQVLASLPQLIYCFSDYFNPVVSFSSLAGLKKNIQGVKGLSCFSVIYNGARWSWPVGG